MQFKAIMNRAAFNARKASPYIFFGVGVASFGGAIATAIRATMNLEAILDAHKIERDYISEHLKGFEESAENYTPEELEEEQKGHKKQVRTLYFHTVGKIARLYAPTMAFGALSLGSFTASAGILRGRYLMAAGALESVSEAFENYRSRVIEDAGEDKDREYYYGLKKEKITVEETDPETGKTKKVKKEVLTGNPDGLFTYRFEKYDWQTGKGSTQWDQSSVYNYNYIFGIISQMQNRLNAGEVVYLDRVLDELGFKNDNLDEHLAGWLPGDQIECGLEDTDGRIIYDTLQFMYGDDPDVTLRFNPRVNVFAKQKEETAEIIPFEKGIAESNDISEKAGVVNE